MKSAGLKPRHILLVIVIYLLIFFAGVFVMIYFPYNRLKKPSQRMAHFMAMDYESQGTMTGGEKPKEVGSVIVDADGEIIEYEQPLAFDFLTYETDEQKVLSYYQKWIKHTLTDTLSGTETSRLVFVWDQMVSVIVFGIPLDDGGAVFILQDVWDLNVTVITFAVIYTILYIAAVTALLVTRKKRIAMDKSQKEYIANTTHSLKSPIASIKALAETINAGLVTDSDTIRHYNGVIIRESVTLEHTVSDMLRLSHIQSEQIDYSKNPASPADIFTPVIEKYSALCYDIMVNFEYPDSISELPDVRTNKDLICELLEIILSNAMKFVRDDGTIRLDASCNGKHMLVSVYNDGEPIDDETGRHMFERFYKVTSQSNPHGSGLGLAIAREITDLLGEKIWYENSGTDGVTFFFTISLR